ncbi:hypothetical protein RchiOBHm_Chr1g0343741 [Rosa chinensis]|uniref:KIB1-4 beta-propeller domain-containing protein n=1 Tax=Rosa chinensis TaxID=74649 RepID=A0A2P6SEC7_ROSCH|nr:uncharacterized protein LOC112165845 [Rosa chinensis]PRQ57025.1 hypothetical protein RchiOBHm_Chr1g0343741 [Rosa chinensis]
MEADLREIWADRIRYNNFVFKATISADPILNAKDCINVVVIYEDYCRLAFIRLNKLKTLHGLMLTTYVDNRWTLIREVVHTEDKFYAMNRWSQLLSFDITAQSNLNVKLVGHKISGTKFMQRYLVYSTEKKLLMVDRYCFYEKVDGFSKRVTKEFKVFYFNFDRCEWTEKKTLGDVALFIGDNSSISVLASNFSGCKPNCIYFNHDCDRIGKDFKHYNFAVYNVETGIVSQPYAKYANTLVNMANRPCIWIVPTFQASD